MVQVKQDEKLVNVFLFENGQDGYKNYRIPALLVTKKGTVLAFCEGRTGGDSGDINMLVKRSEDNGKTWSKQQVVWDDDVNTCGNPCPVVDQDTGTIWLPMSWNLGSYTQGSEAGRTSVDSMNTRRVFVCSSSDDGLTWSKPIEITKMVKKDHWCWYGTGPGVGIQLQTGPDKGRLVIPCHYGAYKKPARGGAFRAAYGNTIFIANVIYSDDHGKTWQLGGAVAPNHKDPAGLGENQVVELANGTLMMNARRTHPDHLYRAVATSKDGGLTWSNSRYDETLVEPDKWGCQGSLLRYSLKGVNDRNRLLFFNPASQTERKNMTVRLSYDEGWSWPVAKLIFSGTTMGYSCLTVLRDKTIGLLYEREGITFTKFSLDWLTNGEDAYLSQK